MKRNVVKYGGAGFLVICALILVRCHSAPDPLPITFVESTFEAGADEWTGDFAFYKTGQESTVKFDLKQELLPSVLKSTFHGLKLEGQNQGDSLFLFIKKKISNLDPNIIYKVAYEINLASNLPDTIGSSGRLVYLKAGASTAEPSKIDINGIYGATIKNGALAKSGKEMLLLGNIGNGLDSTYYRAIPRNNANLAVEVTSSDKGEIWLCIGVNTKYKGNIALYFDRIYAAVGKKTTTP